MSAASTVATIAVLTVLLTAVSGLYAAHVAAIALLETFVWPDPSATVSAAKALLRPECALPLTGPPSADEREMRLAMLITLVARRTRSADRAAGVLTLFSAMPS